MLKCYFKSMCDNPAEYLCCNECTVRGCWQRCRDKAEDCGYLDDAPREVTVVYYNVVNKGGKLKMYYTKGGNISPLRDEEVREEDMLAEMAENEATTLVNALNDEKKRNVWSLVKVREETILLEE